MITVAHYEQQSNGAVDPKLLVVIGSRRLVLPPRAWMDCMGIDIDTGWEWWEIVVDRTVPSKARSPPAGTHHVVNRAEQVMKTAITAGDGAQSRPAPATLPRTYSMGNKWAQGRAGRRLAD